MAEEFDLERLPGNPRMCETVRDFLTRQRKFMGRTKWPPGTKFECHGCADCCRWYFIILNTDDKLAEELITRVKYPHGFWVLMPENRLKVQMPGFFFFGNIPSDQREFITVTGRTWGYWVLNKKRGKPVIYTPTPCIHLTDENKCEIYEERPRVCKVYFCGRYPIIA